MIAPPARSSFAPEFVVAAVEEGEATVAGAVAEGFGRPKPDTPLAVKGPGTADADAPCPARNPTDCC